MTTPSNVAAIPVTLKPGVGSAYGNGWTQLWRHFGVLLVIGIIGFIIQLVLNIPNWIIQFSTETTIESFGLWWIVLLLVSLAFSVLIVGPINYGQSYAYLKAARGDKLEVQDMFESFRNYWHVVAANILVGLIVGLGFILLIIPGIIFACKLAFIPYLVVDKKMSATKAINESWHMTNGHAGQVFLVGLLAIPISIAGFICLGIGLIIAAMWISSAFASLYHAVSLEKGVPVTPAPAAPPPQTAT
jgi:uncharacterized membrane protein